MKRSTKEVMYQNPLDFWMTSKKLKIATSRLDDRTDMWSPGQEIIIECNETGKQVKARITQSYLKMVKDVNQLEAHAIQGYTVEEHTEDILSVYTDEAHTGSVITIVVWELI